MNNLLVRSATPAQRLEAIIQASAARRRDVSDDVRHTIEYVERLIRRDKLAPGDRLVEFDLAQRVGVGRASAREALRILAGESVVSLSHNRGASVRRLSPEDVVDIIEAGSSVVLSGVQTFLARHSVISSDIELDLSYAHTRIERTGQRSRQILRRMADYHIVLNYYSGNRYYNDFLSVLRVDIYNFELGNLLSEEDIRFCIRAYRQIHKNIISLKPETVESVREMQNYVRTRMAELSA